MLGKLFTRVINTRLESWAEEYGIYIEAQNGFRKGRGTVDSLFILNQMVNSFVESGKKLYAFFIDYSKAFDYVVRDNLWYKLLQYGVNGKILTIIMSMYQHVKTKVFLYGDTSAPFECKLGVRQGECLSPFLFSMYINDLEMELSTGNAGITVCDVKIFLLFYADDAVIFGESIEDLQGGIDTLFTYCNRWKLKLNTEKSQVMVFKKGRRSAQETWRYGNVDIKVTNIIPYLGLVISANGSFNQAQVTLAAQANKALFTFHKNLSRFPGLTPKVVLSLFDKMITPILNYASEVWGFHAAPNIERVHLKFCKSILGVKSSTQNNFIYGELNRQPMKAMRMYNIIKYWLQLVHGEISLYANQCYINSLHELEQRPRQCWANSVKNLLEQNGFGDAWVNQGVGDRNTFVLVFKNRLCDICQQTWQEELTNSTRALFYRNIKETLEFSSYLDVVQIEALSRLIVSSHGLRIESGRWDTTVTPRERRFCVSCKNVVEDEFHFVLQCPLYSDIREKYIKTYYRTKVSMFKLVGLFNLSNKRTIIGLAKYVYLAFKVRDTYVAAH